MFYNFRQNNSGGSFVVDKIAGLNVNVIIQANSAEEANRFADDIGIYFNGCDDGRDCSCCGDRWYDVNPSDAFDVPSSYGENVLGENYTPDDMWTEKGSGVCIHYLDGTRIWVYPIKICRCWSVSGKSFVVNGPFCSRGVKDAYNASNVTVGVQIFSGVQLYCCGQVR